jgi:hypothetical protein
MLESAVARFPKDSIACRESQQSIERTLMDPRQLCQRGNRLRLARPNVIGNPQFSDSADRAAQRHAGKHSAQLFCFCRCHWNYDNVLAPRLSVIQCAQIDLTSPPSMRRLDPVIQRAAGDTRNAIKSAISSGWP